MSTYEARKEKRRALLTVEVDPSLKQLCEKIASNRDETLSQVVRRGLRQYAEEHSQAEFFPGRHRSLDRLKVKK